MAKKISESKDIKKERPAKRKKTVMEATPEQYFVLQSGTPIKSVEQLAMMMDSISDDDFNFHVTEEKNDFANWIRDVFGDENLAEKLNETKCRKENQITLLKHAVHLKG